VAALLSSVQVALEVNDSFAVISTHSPVVVQELPGRNVLLLRRAGNLARVEAPEIETLASTSACLRVACSTSTTARATFVESSWA